MRRITIPDPTRRLLELAGVSALAIAQPVLADLADDPGTFVLRRTTPVEIAAFTAILLLAPPLIAWGIEELARRLQRRAVVPLHGILLAAAALLWAMQLAAEADLTRLLAVALAVGAAAAVGLSAHRPATRSILSSLSVLVPGLAAWFLLVSPVADVPFGGGGAAPSAQSVPGEHPPIVFIVLDELPTLSLMDRSGTISGARYPAFASLAGTATWYRNHTVIAPGTAYSLPAIVTSTEPEFRKLPAAAHHPVNLFSLLAPTYELHVIEPEWLCAPELGCNAPNAGGSGLAGLVHDAWRLLAERVVPGAESATSTVAGNDPGAVFVGDEELVLAAPQALDSFIDGLGRSERPRLDYIHALAPHQPWRFLPDGREHGGRELEASFLGGWSDDRAAEANRVRHLLQLQWADAQLGRILERLEDLGVLDESLVVVTADHGVAFRGGASLRASGPDTLHEIYWAPLLVKLPGQRAGSIVDAPVTSLDVLPTVLAEANMPPRPGVLGVALDPSRPPERDGDRRVWVGSNTELAADARFTTIDGDRWFAALLDSAARNPGPLPLDVYRQGPNGDLIGSAVAELRIRPSELDPTVDGIERFDAVDATGPSPPTWMEITLPPGEPTELAIALNGTVAATPLARSGGDGRRAVAVLPPSLLVDGRNELAIYAVERGDGGRRVLVGGPIS